MKKQWYLLVSTVLVATLIAGCTNKKEGVSVEQAPIETASVQGIEENVEASLEEESSKEAAKEAATAESETITFTDSCGRTVAIPAHIHKVAPSGSVAQMIIYSVAPDKLACWAGKLGEEQKKYIEDQYEALPITGQFYGKGDLNLEALMETAPDLIIDFGDKKKSVVEDMDNIQEQTGIPTIFIEATVETYPKMFRTLGRLLENEAQGEKLAEYTEKTYSDARVACEKLKEEEKVSVMFGTGETGLDCNAKGSIHCGVLEAIGAENAIIVSEVSNKGGGNTVTMEEVLTADPNVILLEAGEAYEKVLDDPYWSGLTAVKEGKVYEIPYGPYHFLASPPSINQIIGIKWLGNLIYPQLYPYDMVKELQDFYELFWHYELSEEDAKTLLVHSTLKE